MSLSDKRLGEFYFQKILPFVPDEKAQTHKMIRVVDESGEDYLYPENSFVAIELPRLAEDAFMALAYLVFYVANIYSCCIDFINGKF